MKQFHIQVGEKRGADDHERNEDGKFEGFSYDADVSDSEALAALRRDSHSSSAWEQMARFSGSSGRFTLEKLVEEEEDEED